MIGSKTLKPGAGVKMEMIGDKTRGKDMRSSPANTLKPCPFCGSKNILFHEANRTYQVACVDCGAMAQYAYSKKEAVTNWNRRAGDE